jgi:hypothetical protein
LQAAFHAKGYMMSHDEIRVMNWCPACQQRHLDAGAMLADNVRLCIQLLRQVNPGGDIYVWSDMFDPYHNAHANYYLVRGNLTNSWLGLDPQVIILPWNIATRTNSLQFFSGRGHREVLAGYYDSGANRIATWLDTAQLFPGILGVMYTTWRSDWSNLEAFAGVVSDFEIHHSWQLGMQPVAGGLRLELPTVAGNGYTILRSGDLRNWDVWTNFNAAAAIGRCVDNQFPSNSPTYYRAMTAP